LAAALTRFLQEYPWTSDGLSRTERRLLELTNGGGTKLSTLFPRMHDGERAYHVTDSSLADMAESLSRTSPPLITLHRADGPASRGSLRAAVTLTETGRSVLAGEADRVAICGIDRWLGGVHLQSGAHVWRWNDGEARVVETPAPAPRNPNPGTSEP